MINLSERTVNFVECSIQKQLTDQDSLKEAIFDLVQLYEYGEGDTPLNAELDMATDEIIKTLELFPEFVMFCEKLDAFMDHHYQMWWDKNH
jgi:hypothetical protein